MNKSAGRILVIDDDPQIRKLFLIKLSSEGYDTLEALNGEEGIKCYRRELPDLVITDLVMPEKDGIEVITELKKDYPDVKIIAISGGGRTDPKAYLHIAKHFGAQLTFSKPIDWAEMMAGVREMIG
jgi:CheY-like chemotaxis protein